nr:hypothetical protein [Tanacetum cinerariifolium]
MSGGGGVAVVVGDGGVVIVDGGVVFGGGSGSGTAAAGGDSDGGGGSGVNRRRVRESDIDDRIDRSEGNNFGFAGKSPSEKFSGDGGCGLPAVAAGEKGGWPPVEESNKRIIMVNVIPPDHVDDVPVVEPNQHDDVPIVPEPVLVDEDEDPKEEEP